MSRKRTSILLFSDDKEISSTVQNALSGLQGLKMQSEEVSVSNINGKALELASENDIVIFATDPENADDLNAIKALEQRRGESTVFLALTDSNIPLARARALSDAGVDDVLPYPMPDDELSRQVDKWIKKRAASLFSGNEKEGKVIAVAQARGGIGSTTVAVNLADHLQTRKSRFRKDPGNSVALVDLDLQFGTVGDFLDVPPQHALYQMAAGGLIPDASWVDQSLTETEGGLNVLLSPYEFVPLDSVTTGQIEALADILRFNQDFVVFDLPRALVDWVQPVVEVADLLVVVTDTTVPSIHSASRLIDFYRGENPNLEVEVVINKEKRPLVQAPHHKEAAKALDLKFEYWLPNDPKAARTAIDYGKPLSEVAGRSELNKGITALAKGLVKRMSTTERATV